MKDLLYIFIGGGVGSTARYIVSSYTQKMWNINSFPVGTFVVNVLGCFIIGFLIAYFTKVDNSLKYLLITGFCGGFTTFSTFSAENYSLWQQQEYGTLAVYILLSIILGLAAVVLGMKSEIVLH
ncbi:fluoride efflux transporter CrcB [Chryseobacterium sp. CT-SW4]|uniref:fluoride efflux transporter CrcB n=1 Tax=Chryseobacterium sp. SW-1 TaxID=3157343 RepID=UPI003B01B67B